MRGFRQIKALKSACFTEQGERESWEYLLCPPHLSLMCRYLKRRGSSGGCTLVAEMLSTWAHKGICSVLFGGPSFSVSVGNERGLLFKWMWQRLQWTIRAPPPLPPGPHWTMLKQSEIKVLSFCIVEGQYVAYMCRFVPTNTTVKPVCGALMWLLDNSGMCTSCQSTAEILAFSMWTRPPLVTWYWD